MATNWQPPFGLPFPPFPPPAAQQPPPHPHQQQHHPHQPRSDGQGPPSDAYQQPAAFFPPPPPPSHIPGLNLQAHNQNAHSQNAHQAQFPQAWPSTFPTPEQLNQWSQLQMDMQHLPFMMMQNPPPLPGLGFAPNHPSQSPFQPATPTQPFPPLPNNLPPAPYPQAASQPLPTPNRPFTQKERVADVMDSEKEEGEVSEGGSNSPAVNGRGRPEPPRSVPPSALRLANEPVAARQEPYDPGHPAVNRAAPQSKPTAPAKSLVKTIAQQRAEAKDFIKLLHKNNIGYHALAAEGLDEGPLRDLYQSLNLPSAPVQVPSVPKANNAPQPSLRNGVNNVASPSVPTSTGSNPITPVNTSTPPAKSVPSPVQGNRAEYLKRLQAAKKGKQNGGTKVTSPQKTPPPTATASKSPPVPQGPALAKRAQELAEAEKKKAKTTELIRKRIEALKNSSSSPASTPTAIPLHPAHKQADASSSTFSASTPQNVPPSPFGNIPGLFMNSSPTVPQNQAPITPGPGSRKRPRSPTMDSPGLPLDGIIAQDTVGSVPSQATPTQNASTRGSHTLPILPGLQSRPASVKPSVSGISTPGPQTPSSTARSQELDEKAKKQAALKERLQKKIEEQKRESERRLASVQNSPNSLVQQSPVPPASGSVQDMSRGPKRRRKVDVEAEQSAVDSEIAENTARLAQITKELELLNANDAKLRRDKERLQAELESMGIDTEGMPHAELQARRDEIEREQEAAPSALQPPSNLAIKPVSTSTQSATVPNDSASEQAPANTEGASRYMSQSNGNQQFVSAGIPGLSASYSQEYTPSQKSQKHSTFDQPAAMRGNTDPSVKLAPAKPVAVLSERDANSDKPMTPVDDEEDFYSPEPVAVASVLDQSESTSASLTQTKSLSEEGEMIMSESEEEDYEPEEILEPQINTHNAINDGPEQMSIAASSQASPAPLLSVSQTLTEEEDSYEPPDADQPMLDVDSDAEVAGEEDMDMSSSDDSDSDSDSDASSKSSIKRSNDPTPASNSKNAESSVTVADDLAPQLRPVVSAVESTSDHPSQAYVSEDSDKKQDKTDPKTFVPYESPLRLFKSYRYHPNFSQNVSSGYLSMTYSHQIDPMKELCATEASGEPCSGANCSFQHYRDMEITGEKLLVQLGTANPGKTLEERQRWNDGLRSVLKDLRQKNTRDPNGIAMEIANYRRQFLQDDSRVVNL